MRSRWDGLLLLLPQIFINIFFLLLQWGLTRLSKHVLDLSSSTPAQTSESFYPRPESSFVVCCIYFHVAVTSLICKTGNETFLYAATLCIRIRCICHNTDKKAMNINVFSILGSTNVSTVINYKSLQDSTINCY